MAAKTTVTTSHTAVGVGATLKVAQRGELITFGLSGTYAQTHVVERAVTPDESAWEVVLGPYSTANATVAATFTTERDNERFRSRCTSDTSGTGVAVLSDEDMLVRKLTDDEGNVIMEHYQSGSSIPVGPVAIAATATLNREEHAGRVCIVSMAAATVTLTLPAATGSGDVYKFYVLVNATPSSLVIEAATGGSDLQGVLALASDIAGVSITSAVADNTITMNGTTSGALPGTWIEIIDVSAGIFAVTGGLAASGTELDPWSAA